MNQEQLLSSWHGSLKLDFVKNNDATEIAHSYSRSPLKLQRSFYPEGAEVCHSTILHTAGGVVGGDRLSIDLNLRPHTQALLSTTAAGKIYRSNGKVAHQTTHAQVAQGACLEWLPQEVIVFNGADYEQQMRVDLAEGATWLGWDMMRLGRTARGEKFLEGKVRSHTEVWQSGKPLWIDRQLLIGGEALIYNPNCLGSQSVIASLAWLGQAVTPELVQQARNCATELAIAGDIGVTRLTQGMLCRYRGNSTVAARSWFVGVWHLLRQAFLDRPACLPRIWMISC